MRLMRAAAVIAWLLRALGWAVLGAMAAAGLALSAVALLAGSDLGRPVLARTLVRYVDDQLAGSLALDGIDVLPNGGLALRGLRVTDPAGNLVLAVDRALFTADITRLRNRSVGLSVELDGPAVILEEEPGGFSIARAFAPAHPSPARPGAATRPAQPPGGGWTVRLQRLVVRDGSVWWRDAAGDTRVEASGLTLDGRGVLGPGRLRAELALRGALETPLAAPLDLEIRAAQDGTYLRVPVLRAEVGGTVLEGLGQGDLAARTGRIAITRAALERENVRAVLPAAGDGSDVAFTGFAESDGRLLTAALHAAPRGGVKAAGRADLAAALRLDGAQAIGLDADVDRLDPARLHAAAPPGDLTLKGSGAASGTSLATLRGQVDLAIGRCRLRGGAFGPGAVQGSVSRGSWMIRRLTLEAPGVGVDGNLAWRAGGPVAGRAAVDGRDLALAVRNLEALLDTPLPPLAGKARIEATVAGTEARPVVDAAVTAPALATGDLSVSGVRAEAHLAGPLDAPTGQLTAIAAAIRRGGGQVAGTASLRATLDGEGGALSASAALPWLGKESFTLTARGRRAGARGEAVLLSELALGYPGTRYLLTAPATVRLDGPRVDQLQLAAGPQRITLAGGLSPGGGLDARLGLEAVRLETLPPAVLPPDLGLAGAVTADVRATGTSARPRVDGRFAFAGAAVRGIDQLAGDGTLRWDGGARRLGAAATVRRGAGGAADLAIDLPLPLRGRRGEPLEARLRSDALPVAALLRAAGVELAADGQLALDVAASGTVGAPALTARARLRDGTYEDLGGIGADLAADAPGRRVTVTLTSTLGGAPAFDARVAAPLDLGGLLERPEVALRAFRTAPLTGEARLTGLLLQDLAGRLGFPERLSGLLTAALAVEGTPTAPRATLTADLGAATLGGLAGLGGHLEARAAGDRVSAGLRVTSNGARVLEATGSLAAPLERLATRAGLRAAALRLEGQLPDVPLDQAAGAGAPFAGQVAGGFRADGTLAAPRVRVDLRGTGLTLEGRPVGDVTATLVSAAGRTEGDVALAAAAGGTLAASVKVEAQLAIDTTAAAFQAAPAEARVRADALDLRFLPAVLPGLVRVAEGRLDADVVSRAPLGAPAPRGAARLAGGRLAISEYGDWTDLAVDASVTADAVVIEQLAARRGQGTVRGQGSLKGMASGTGVLDGRLEARRLPLAQSGVEFATVDLGMALTGTWRPGELAAKVTVDRGASISLPKRTPRALQPIAQRSDIVVGSRRKARPKVSGEEPGRGKRPFDLRIQVVAPSRVQVTGENPYVRAELRADATYEQVGGEQYMSGTVEVLRGDVEPIGGRRFQVKRGRLTFTGGPPKAALIDVEAEYANPAAIVTVNVAGPLSNPDIRLTSQPPMDESQIAVLIATGRMEPRGGMTAQTPIGTSNAFTVGQTQAGQSLQQQQVQTQQQSSGFVTAGTLVFNQLLANKLPLDSFALDTGALRAGKYVSENVYVSYTRRLDTQLQQGVNQNEIELHYQITPRWTFELRYGDALSGGGSLVWSKSY